MSKVSVIIPVYNVEKYLKKCLDSIICQTLNDIEIICVNDGSTDASLSILEEYAKNDQRIKVISQKNQGVSVARNTGIENSSADYIMFVDSDDSIAPETCEQSLQKIIEENADICCFGINENREGTITQRDWELKYLNLYENSELNTEGKKAFIMNACGKLFKKDFLIDYKIFFPVGIKTGEDTIFNLSCLFNDAKYTLLNKFFYNYLVTRKDSATNSLKNAILNDIEGYKYFLNTELFQNASDSMKIIALEKFIGQLRYYYYKTNKHRLRYSTQIVEFRGYLFKKISKKLLKKVSNIKFISTKIFLKLFFSIKNSPDKTHKTITFLGIRVKIKKHRKIKET